MKSKQRLISLFFSYLVFFSCFESILSVSVNNFTGVQGYPKRKSIKGLQTDFQDYNEVIGNEVHGVVFNFVWQTWQPSKTSSCSSGQVLYDGYCFNIEGSTASQVKIYSDAGVVVTGIFWGVPSWARRSCSSSQVVDPMFCAPTDAGSTDFGRFVGFIAHYFNGANGHGRVADFVIHNEVNASGYFNYGCAKGTCQVETWTTIYALSFNSAYDYVKKEQTDGKVLISFEHNFDSSLDYMLSSNWPVCSVQTFLISLSKKLGSRKWRVAYHCYPRNLLDPYISANDYPQVTFGNIGIISGWLRQKFPNNPEAYEIQLTENGINGVSSSQYSAQKTNLCVAFRNILGTPGIESFIYHRLKDHPDEQAQGLGLGLWTSSGGYKPAWETYALANRKVSGGNICGFENLPYTIMVRAKGAEFHWVSTRMLPSGFTAEDSYKLLREKAEGTELVFECRVGGSKGSHTLISKDYNCEGQFNMGPMGYIYNSPSVSGTVPIYRCMVPSNGDHFISPDSNCEGFTVEALMGYALE